ncbi:MAG: pyridoxal phosphate-dependent aminotransferase [Desulfovibrionaceae bacterium]|jgi:aspartate aminotransferase
MGAAAGYIMEALKSASWIRKMFEEGIRLKGQYGEDNVYDFSLGNPDVPPPPEVGRALAAFAETTSKPMSIGYMPNAGYPSLREALARKLASEQKVSLAGKDIIVTCGAAGGLNAFFKAVLDPGDEVIAPSPYFVEYATYVSNHNGVFKSAPTKPGTYELDLEAIEAALTEKTRVVLINTPNNPTGQIYSEDQIKQLGELLGSRKPGGRPIFLCSDEPYRFLAFDGAVVPPVLSHYEFSVVANSFSKSLSLAGERVGFLALNPDMEDQAGLMAGLILANRCLGYVNAPSIGQRIVEQALGAQADVSIYDRRRKAMAEVLDAAGINYPTPKGAFYFFPDAPGGDDVEFCRALQEERILAVPGRGFGCSGAFRLAFCVEEKVIRNSAESFVKATARFK